MSQAPSSARVDPAQDNDSTSTGELDPHTANDQDPALPNPAAGLTSMSSPTPVPQPQLQPLAIQPTSPSRHIPPPLFSPTFRPGSPVNRKRSEVKDDDIHSSNDYFRQNAGSFYSLGGSSGTRTGGSGGGNGSGSSSSPFPPLKKSKTSPPLSHSNLTAYRSSKEADPLSPQTSPIIEPFETFEAFDAISTETISAITLDPTTTTTTTDAPSLSRRSSGSTHKGGTPPLLRARTMEEISSRTLPSSVLDSLSKASTTAIGNLNLGGVSGRGILPERAMGVITSRPNSRQGSPTVTMTSRESTPMYADEFSAQESPHPLSRVKNNKRELSVTPSEETVSSEEGFQQRNILDTLEDYNEEADPDYEPAADTTVDEEGDTRQSSVDLDDEDSFGEIDENNIHNAQFEVGFDDDDDDDAAFYGILDDDDEAIDAADAFVDTDPECKDRFTDAEIAALDEEARTEGIVHMIQKYVVSDMYPMKKLLLMFFPEPEIVAFPKGISKRQVFDYLSSKWQEDLSRRKRLEHVHKLEQVIELLKSSKKIMVLTGAGVSVSCGIPDFRSPDGIYSRLSEFQLRDPQQMFDLRFFRRRPEIFYSFAREIFPSNFTPSPSHNFIKLLEDKGKLLRNYTQNIDTLEQKAGIHNILQCHGSFATASCVRCHHQVPGDEIKDAIFNQQVAYCKVCTEGETESSVPKASTLKLPTASNRSISKARISSSLLDDSSSSSSEDELDQDPPALMKPDIVFFGEPLPSGFNDHLEDDRLETDLLIVIGSSLKVAPVSDIMLRLPPKIPQILINRTPITHTEFDVQLLGNCDTIVAELCRMAGWELQHEKLPEGTSNVTNMDTNTNFDGAGVGGRAHWSLVEPNTYLFEGAILGDIEYESSQKRQLTASTSAADVLASGINKGRKRGRFENRHFGGAASSTGDGSSSDADDEGAWSSRRYGRSRERMEMDHIHADIDSDDDDKSDTSQATITKGDFITIAAESLGPSGSGVSGASWSPFGLPSSFRAPTPTFGATSSAAIVLSSSAPTASFGFGIPKSKSKGTASGNTSDHQTKTSSFFQTIKGFDIPTASPSRPGPLTFSPAPPHSDQRREPGSASLESHFQVFENVNKLPQDLRDLDDDDDDDDDDQFYQHIELELQDDDDQEDEFYDTPKGEVEESEEAQGAEPMSESDPVYVSGHGEDPHSSFRIGQYLDLPEEDMKMPSPSPQPEDQRDFDPVDIDEEDYQDAEEDLDGDRTYNSSMGSGSLNPSMQHSGNQRMQGNQSYALSSPSQSFIEAFMNEDSPSPPPGPFSLTQSHQYQQQQDPPHQEH